MRCFILPLRAVLSALSFVSVSLWAGNPNQISVGAIRWDAWVGDGFDTTSNVGGKVEATLGPKHWHYRLPFYAQITGDNSVAIKGDNAAVFEQELAYAEAAGLGYFAYVMYPEGRALSYAINLHAAATTSVKFACIYGGSGPAIWNGTGGYRDRLLTYFTNPGYQTVTIGGATRPLVYVFSAQLMTDPTTGFGSWANAKAALDSLEAASISQGTGAPYFVIMNFDAATAFSEKTNLGADAVSSYGSGGGSASGSTYSSWRNNEQAAWNSYKTSRGGKVIPWVSTGFDKRTRYEVWVPWETPPPSYFLNYVEPAFATEVASQLQAAIDWCGLAANSSAAEAKSVLIYSWNEFDEDGWICPTLAKGPDRVNAIAGVLGAAGVTNGATAIQNWTFNSSAESWSTYFQVSALTHSPASPGTISGNVMGTDPQIVSADNLGLNINNHHIIAVRFKNNTGGTTGQVYFSTTTATTFGSPKVRHLTLTAMDTRHRTHYANFAGITDWVGTLKRVRFDPEQGSPSGSFSIDSIKVQDTAPACDYTAFDLAGCWLLDETSSSLRAADASGEGGIGYLNGGVSWSAGKIGNAAVFATNGDSVVVHDSVRLNSMPGLTVAGWVWRTSATTQTSVPFGKDGSFRITISSGGVPTFVVGTTGNLWYSTNTTLGFGATLATGQWYHLAATYDGSLLRTYVNGTLTATSAMTIGGAIAPTTSDFCLSYQPAGTIDWFKGKIDEVVVARRALNAAEIGQLYLATQ